VQLNEDIRADDLFKKCYDKEYGIYSPYSKISTIIAVKAKTLLENKKMQRIFLASYMNFDLRTQFLSLLTMQKVRQHFDTVLWVYHH